MSTVPGSTNRAIASLSLLATLFFPIPTSQAAPVPIPSMDASWLETLNYYRLSSGVEPVSENPIFSANAMKHSIYLAKSDPKYFTGIYENPHSENPESPYYTKEGANSGTNLTSIARESEAIDSWMQAPLHAIGLLRDNLKTTGYATAISDRTGQAHTGLDVINGLVGSRQKVITFPGNGAIVRQNEFWGESPDPRESCGKDWQNFRGLPIFASLITTPPRDITGKIATPDGKTLVPGDDLCVVTQYSWVSTDRVISYGNQIMADEKLVLLIAKSPLNPGEHSVSVSGTGISSLNWKFTVIERPATVNFWFGSEETIKWDQSMGSKDNQIVGYTVVARDQKSRDTKTFRTTETNLVTHNWKQGSYWVCVQARGQISESECSALWGYTINRKPEQIYVMYSRRNPILLTWKSSDRTAPDAKLQSIKIELRIAGKSKTFESIEIPASAQEWTLPKLSFGEYEFCVVGVNSYGHPECVWQTFEIVSKKIPSYSLPVTSLKVGERISIWNDFDNTFSLQITSTHICKAEAGRYWIEVTALKTGSCTFEISADETSDYLSFNKRFSLMITKVSSNSTQRVTIECVKGNNVKFVTGIKPKCPAGYRRR